MKGKNWVKVKSSKYEIFKFKKPGDTITGVLERTGQGKFSKYYIIDGKLINGSVQLDAVLPELIGREVKIVFQGTVKTAKGNSVKVFDIFSR